MEHSHHPSRSERAPKPRSTAELVHAAQLLTDNARKYAEVIEGSEETLDPFIAFEFKEKFISVARHHMPQSRLEGRLKETALDLDDTFAIIQTELLTLSRGAVVESHLGPLEDYVEWLLKAHTDEALELFEADPALKRDVVRRLDLAKARLGLDITS